MRNILFAIVCIAMLALNVCIFLRWIDSSSFHFLALSTGLVFAVLALNFIYDLGCVGKEEKSTELDSSRNLGVVSSDSCVLLSLLQEKGRLLDFVMDDISGYPDQDVGKVARVVHQGVRDVVHSAFDIVPIYEGKEGEQISFTETFDPMIYKLVGLGTKKPPFSASVLHRGWRARKCELPTKNDSSELVLQSVEIEVK